MREPRKIRSFALPESLLDAAKEQAVVERRSVTSLVELAVEQYLERAKGER